MYKGLQVAVVVPCYNEERKIADVLRSMPELVDRVYLVDDASHDASVQIAEQAALECGVALTVVQQEKMQGSALRSVRVTNVHMRTISIWWQSWLATARWIRTT
ncbi:glycosyltransferase [Achromobacter xylosoxidans]